MAKATLRFQTQNLFRKYLIQLLLFVLTGAIELLLRNFKDTLGFVRDCWREQPEAFLKELNSNTKH